MIVVAAEPLTYFHDAEHAGDSQRALMRQTRLRSLCFPEWCGPWHIVTITAEGHTLLLTVMEGYPSAVAMTDYLPAKRLQSF